MKIKKIFPKSLFLFASIFLMIFLVQTESTNAYWRYEDVAYYVPKTSTGNQPVYRFYSPNHRAHFFTISASEKNRIISTYPEQEWRYEGIAYYVPKTSTGNQPVYRFYSTNYRTHFFTMSATERNRIISTYPEQEWRYEGIAYYVPKTSTGNQPVYRFFHTTNRAHFFTISENEKERLLIPLLGPEISIGLHQFTEDELEDNSFRISANKAYVIKNKENKTIATISADKQTRVKYLNDSDHTFRIYNSIPEITSEEEITFEAANGNNSEMIFSIDRPEMSFFEYRGKIKLDYSKYDNPETSAYDLIKRIWIINILPLEHYTWGDGELIGNGEMDHNRVMVTSFRTYGYYKIHYAAAWRNAGFIVNATPGNQLYYGYTYERTNKHSSRIRQAAEETRGKIVTSKYSDKKDNVAITPYSSWTDGKTRGMSEGHFNNQCRTYTGAVSDNYKWLKPVDDPYGKHSTLSTCELASRGNHMVGLSANGSVNRAKAGWSWTKILNYYFDNIEIKSIY